MRIWLAGLVLILAGCGSSGHPAAHPKPVKAAQVEQRDVPLFLNTIGNVYALSTVDIMPQVSGELLEAHVKQGDYVEQGQLLYTIDPSPYQAQLDKAKAALLKDQASLVLSKDKVRRYTPLKEEQFISDFNYEQYVTEVAEMEAQVIEDKALIEEAQINLNYCYIHAPISGRISQYQVDPGNIVSPGMQTPLTTLRQLIPIEIRFTVPQRDWQRVKNADLKTALTFTATLPENPDKHYEGKVYFFDNHINLDTGTILIKGTIENLDKDLWPGEFVKVRLFTGHKKDAIVVPESALQVGAKSKYVYLLDTDTMTVKMHDVKTGELVDGGVLVLEGLSAGDTVITDGQINLKNGDKVIIVTQTEKKK